MKKISLSIVVVLMFYVVSFGQEKDTSKPYKNWEIGINAGVAQFTGEYNMFKDARFNHFNHWNSKMNIGFGALVKKNFSHVFALEAAWNYANLEGSWRFDNREIPDFNTQTNELDLNTVWNLNNLFSKKKYDRKIYWYAKIGLGGTHLKAVISETSQNGQYWKFATVPLGTGVAMSLGDNLKLNIGTQWSWVNTDRLDGRKTDMTSGNIKPGNTEADIFGTKLYTHVGLSYSFGKKEKPVPVIVEVPVAEPAPVVVPTPEPATVPTPEPVPEVIFVQPTVVGNVYNIQFGFNFAFDKWNLDKASTSELDRLVKDMTDNPTVDVEIKSHTDSRGAASYNMTLSEKRGKAVSDYLVKQGISVSRIHTKAFGETQLLNKCADGVSCTKEEHAANRRAEATIVIWKEK